jgi:hypothetical protein
MAKQLLIFFQLVFMLGALGQVKDSYVQGEFMSLEQADKKWGHALFSEEQFKKATPDKRASMIVGLVRSKKLENASLDTVRKLLGPPDGYFLDDTIPAYLLGTRKPGQKKDIWQLVLIPNEERAQVIEIKIHKNCCYKED